MKTIQARPKSAFTLLETLTALAIITILAASLLPSLLNWQNNVQQDRVRATSAVLSQACVRAGLAGVSVPSANRGTLGDLVAWYQTSGYIQNAKVDITNLSLADLGGGSFFDCTDGSAGGGTTSDIYGGGSSLTPGPVAALWWNTRYIQVGLPSLPTGAASLDLEGSADGQTWSVVAPGVTDTYTDGPFDPNTTRYYRVVAVIPSSRIPGPTAEAVTAPPLSAPNSLSVVLGSVTTSGTTPKTPPAGPVTYTLPAVPNLGNSGTSAGLDFGGGWQWLVGGTSQTVSPYTGGAGSAPLAAPGAITFNNLTSYNYTLTLPALPHDLVDENGRIYDFAAGWMLCSSTTGQTWTYSPAFDWRSTLGPPSTRTGFGWTCQQDGSWLENPAPITFDATPATTYYYQLVGRDTAGLLVYGNVVSITTPAADGGTSTPPASPNAPLAPAQVAITNLAQTSLTVTMPSLPDRAVSMTLEASADGGNSWVVVASGLGDGEVVPQTNLTSAKSYAYCAAAVNSFGATQGEPRSVVTLGGLPAVPGLVTVGNRTTSSYTFTFPQLPNAATSFTLQTSANGLTWTNVGTGYGSGAVVPLTGLAPNTSAPYLLLAVNQYGYAPGAPFFATTGGLPSTPSTPTVANLGATGFDLRLPGLPTGADSLTLETSPDNGTTWAAQDGETNLAGLAVVSETASPATTHTYRVVAVNQWGEAPSSALTVTTPQSPAAPGNVNLSNLGDTGFRLLMPPLPTGADTLKLETTTDAGTTWLTGTSGLAGGTAVNESGLTPNTAYYYRVVAVNQWGETPGSGFTVTTAGPPQAPGLTVVDSVTPTSLALHLPGLPIGATFLSLQTSPDNAAWTTVENNLDGGATVPLTGLTPLTSYNYRLTADNGYGSTPGLPFSATTGGLPAAPAAMTVGSLTPTSFNLTMPALPSGATSFDLLVSNDGTTWPATPSVSALGAGGVVPQTGLTANTAYFYRLLSVNAWGTTPGDIASVTTPGAPAAPGEVAVSGQTSSSFILTLPGLPAGATSLTLEVLSGADWIPLEAVFGAGAPTSNWPGNTVMHETGLNPGTTYQYQLLANNQWGSTPGLSFAATTTVDAPGTPDLPTVSGLTTTSITFTMPALPANATFLSIHRTGAGWLTDGTSAALAAGATVTDNGLTPGTSYSYQVAAQNSNGGFTLGSLFSVGTGRIPAVPGSVSVASGTSGTACLLTMPGLPLSATSLTLQTSTDGGATWLTDGTNTGLAGGAVVSKTGLTLGTAYYYRALAVNAFGSAAGSPLTFATPSLPSAPAAVSASSSTPTTILLTMPALPANATSLTLQSSTDGATWTNDQVGVGGLVGWSEYGKTPDTTYYYRVLAVNTYGSTAGTSASVRTQALPSAPGVATSSNVTATSLTLTMPALPANATSLTLQLTPDGGTTWNSLNTGLAGGATAPQSGLTAGTTYTYRVLAVNAYGSTAGATFTASTASLPSAPDVASPSNVTATSLTLTMPALPANAASLTLQLSSDGGTTWNSANTGLAGGAAVSEPGLTAGATYGFRVLAVNSYGSTAGAPIWVAMASLPSAPGVAASSGLTATAFNLTMPTLPANATSLTLQTSPDAGTTWNNANTGLAGGAVVPKTGLTAATTYYFRVLAVNAYGSTAGGSTTVTTASLPGAPDVGWVNYISATSFSVITPPLLPANATSFTLQNSPDGGTTWNTQNSGQGVSAVLSKSGLTTGATYTYRLLAVNPYGSTAGAAFTAVAGTPTIPGNFWSSGITVTFTSTTSFNLTMPTLPSGATSLTLQTSTDSGSTWTNANTGLGSGATVSKTGLTTGATYYYRVLSVNAAGSTAGSALAVVAGGPGTPGPASASSITSSSFTLTMPTKPAGATTLTLQVMSGGTWVTDTAGLNSGSTVNKTGLTSGTKYIYRVLAVNVNGSTSGTYASVTTP